MTALPPALRRCETARGARLRGRARLPSHSLCFAFAAVPGARADRSNPRRRQDRQGRRLLAHGLSFRRGSRGEGDRRTASIMVINFAKPVNVDVDKLNAAAPDLISAARRDPDGKAVRIALAHRIKFNVMPAAERLFVDLLPEKWIGPPPGLPQAVDRRARANGRATPNGHCSKQRGEAKPQRAAADPREGRRAADLHALRLRAAGRRRRRRRTRRRTRSRCASTGRSAGISPTPRRSMPSTLSSVDGDTDFDASTA